MTKEEGGFLKSFFGQTKGAETVRSDEKIEKPHKRQGRPPYKGAVFGVCIHCTKHTWGHPVVDDYVINTIRWVKRKLGVEQGNKLVVCDACLEGHMKRRGEFERSLIIYGGLGLIVLLVLLLLNFSLQMLFTGLLLLLFFIILSHYKYAPKVAGGKKL